MKKLLTILRHGEAQMGDMASSDFTRPLSIEGIHKIKGITEIVKNRNTSFDLLIKSPSTRTLETANLILEQISIPEVKIEQSIYESSLDNLVGIIKDIPVDISNALLIGHNPALTALVSYLTHDDNIYLSPGTMVRMEVYVGNWDHISQGSASVFEVL